MAQTVTLYYDQTQRILHTLVCEVGPSGTHKVVSSTVEPVIGPTLDLINFAKNVYGAKVGMSNISAYLVGKVF